MHASYRWLEELTGVDARPEEVAERLTSAGLEVEGLERKGEGLASVVVAEVRAIRPHPAAEKLRLVTLFDGEREQEVVCGAPNVPPPGHRVVFARLGAKLPGGLELEERAIRGVVSRGMICSESELGIGEGSEGILVLSDDEPAVPGTPVVEALTLDDTIFAIGLTPNRPDCLGHVGLARELALLYGVPFEPPSVEALTMKEASVAGLTVTIEAPEKCARYGAALVIGGSVRPSPFWLRYRLHCLGLRPISNLVDATNLIMLEQGHPIHGFDLARVRGRSIVVRSAREGEVMPTLDGVERRFTADDLLICDAEGPVAVAGVMGGAESGVGAETKDVLIECAYFEPRSVRRTSRRLGLHTDASHRFERGVDPNGVPRVLARAAALIASLGGGKVERAAIDRVARPIGPKAIHLRPAKMRALLGLEVPEDATRRILEGLGARITASSEAELLVEAPTFRPDLGREADLIEEIARVYGYDAIPTTVPRVRPSSEGTPFVVAFPSRLRHVAAATGLHEAITYGFVAPADLAAARAPSDAVALENPLSEERSVMRTSLLPGLAQAAAHAIRHGAREVALFEVGRTFQLSSDALPLERRRFALLLAGERRGRIGGERPFDFYDGKGAILAILSSLGAPSELVVDDALDAEAPFLHPRRRASIVLGGHGLGSAGELHPDVAEALDLGTRAVYAELDADRLAAFLEAAGDPKAPELPRFPATTRDLALLVDDELPMAEARAVLVDASKPLGESVELFDLYRGENLPAGKKSLAFRIVYRDHERTLTDKTVDKAHRKVIEAAQRRLGATSR